MLFYQSILRRARLLLTFNDCIRFNQDQWVQRLQRQNNTYDALGRLLEQAHEYTLRASDGEYRGQAVRAIQRQTMDRWGNMLTFTNSLNQTTTYEYNALDKVIQQTLPEVNSMDEHGQVTRIAPVNLSGGTKTNTH
jgi:YD repeat-containing protein